NDGAATTEPAVVCEQHLPRPRMRHRLLPADHGHDVSRPDDRGEFRTRSRRYMGGETVADPNSGFDRGNATRSYVELGGNI
ncbi:hypothetical protein LSAT2_008404, partial [Lamellibrachia satsuma]